MGFSIGPGAGRSKDQAPLRGPHFETRLASRPCDRFIQTNEWRGGPTALDKRRRRAHEIGAGRRVAYRGDDRAKRRIGMAKGQVRSNREAKKPKKEKPKEAAGAPGLLKAGVPGKKK
jgi:hypothetical protein